MTKLPEEVFLAKDNFNNNILNLDIENIINILRKLELDYIFNFAGQSSIRIFWDYPVKTVNINLIGSINLLEVIRYLNLKTRVLMIGSGEEYGFVNKKSLTNGLIIMNHRLILKKNNINII